MTTSGVGKRSSGIDLSWDDGAGAAPGPKRDWKKTLLVAGLGLLSWVATFVGMLELIEANVGDLPFTHKIIIGFSVGMLMVMVVWLLDQMFSDIGWMTRLLYAGGYVFLTVISVGFGFGFYWKVLESRGESSRSAESAVSQVQGALHAGVTRLEQLDTTLDSLTAISVEKAAVERQSGTSCPNSRPGNGPRRVLREEDASRFKFAADFVRTRVGAIKGELGGLNGELAKVVANDRSTVDAASGTRNEFMRGLNRRLDMTVTGFNAFRSDPQLRQIRSDLNERADRVTFPDTKGGTYQCPDAQLATALKGVVRAIDELPVLEKPKIAAVEGSEAVIEAFRRLTATMFGAFSFRMPPSPEELRDLQKKAVQSVEGSAQQQARLNQLSEGTGLSKRDYVPLAIALFVDLCLLLVSIKRTGSPLERLVPKMRAAEQGPVIQILSRFNDIHRDKEIRENFEVFRHVVFDYHGDYYAAVPLNAPYRPNMRNGRQAQGFGVSDAEELLQEAHLLGNLFASFEKERIFTRVYSPLLSTSMVQKRLRRQGSKFANAEAFRLYRFRNGAWSEIILGAVMGAARRVETQQRRQRIEDEMFRPQAAPDLAGPDLARPDLAMPNRAAPGIARPDLGRPEFDERSRGTRHDGAYGGERDGRRRGAAASAGERAGDGAAVGDRGFGSSMRAPFMPQVVAGARDGVEARRPANSNTGPAGRPMRDVPPFTDVRPGDGAGNDDWSRHAENVVPHPVLNRPLPAADEAGSSGNGPEASGAGVAGPLQGADGDDRGRRAPAMPTMGEAEAYLEPLPVASEPTVTVAATRETVTYTMPMSEAQLPPSLMVRPPALPMVAAAPGLQAMAQTAPDGEAAAADSRDLREAPEGLAPEGLTPEGLAPAAPEAALSDDVRSLAQRFSKAAREG